jgi:hypothetical protein
MSFFSSIGKALGGVVHTVTNFADKALNILQKPLDFVTKPIQGLMDGLLDKLPLGIGTFVKPFADKFLSMGINWLAAGPLGGVMSFISSAAKTVGTVDSVLHTIDGALNGGVQSLPDPAKQNVQNAIAFAHAQALTA